ncbi:hypothetical protein IKF32_00535 [Candidatus Saccharibacteria bacterium]|nr:hypothetical protein [Candidatus Saccharibacteria bacterium]
MKKKLTGQLQTKRGFTLIELSLSIVFIAILSITITLIITNTIASYRRGIVLNQINTTGMDLADDFRAAIQNSPSKAVTSECAKLYRDQGLTSDLYNQCMDDGARNFVSVMRLATVTIGAGTSSQKEMNNVPVFGAFCTGSYSYVWNSGYFFDEGYTVEEVEPASLKYKKGGTGDEITMSGFRLLKVPDNARAICITATNYTEGGNYRVRNTSNLSVSSTINNGDSTFDISGEKFESIFEDITELLSADNNNNLVLYDMTASAPAYNNANNALFYSMSFILGTIQGGINIKASGNFCATPDEYMIENFDYCAINKFNVAVQATGE